MAWNLNKASFKYVRQNCYTVCTAGRKAKGWKEEPEVGLGRKENLNDSSYPFPLLAGGFGWDFHKSCHLYQQGENLIVKQCYSSRGGQICISLIPNKTSLYISARTFLHFVCCKSLNFGFLFQNRAKINVEILAFPIGRKCHYLSSSA